MVRNKGRQYIRNKPTKWGFKYWVIADVTGYTLDFNLYIGKATESSGNGLGFDVVMVIQMTEKRSRGTVYYFRKGKTDITYCVWHDTKTVLLASTAYAGHSESSVK